MNKAEIIKAVSSITGKSIAVCAEIISTFLIAVKRELVDGGVVEIKKFGVFSVGDNAERLGTNPHTKEKFIIPARKTIKFSASIALKELVNGKRTFDEIKKAPAEAEA